MKVSAHNEKRVPSEKLKIAPYGDREEGLFRMMASMEMGDSLVITDGKELAARLFSAW